MLDNSRSKINNMTFSKYRTSALQPHKVRLRLEKNNSESVPGNSSLLDESCDAHAAVRRLNDDLFCGVNVHQLSWKRGGRRSPAALAPSPIHGTGIYRTLLISNPRLKQRARRTTDFQLLSFLFIAATYTSQRAVVQRFIEHCADTAADLTSRPHGTHGAHLLVNTR